MGEIFVGDRILIEQNTDGYNRTVGRVRKVFRSGNVAADINPVGFSNVTNGFWTKLPQVLLGQFSGKSPVLPELKANWFGRMWSSYGPQWIYDREPWGFDNGAWAAYVAGEELDRDKFLRRLIRAKDRETHPPIVAALPDIVAGGMRSLELSERWTYGVDLTSWPWFLVVQDGMAENAVEQFLCRYEVAGLFLGGSDEFKRSSEKWCEMSHGHGKKFHYGRCNREPWIRDALRIGADSLDTTRPVRCYVGGQRGYYRRFRQMVNGLCPERELEATP